MKNRRVAFSDETYMTLKVYEGERAVFSFARRRLHKYWPHARKRSIDGASACFLGKWLMVHYSEGSGQGGCLAFIDVARNRIEHVSNGAFLTNVAVIRDEYLFAVLNVFYWGHRSSWHVEWRKLHSKTSVSDDSNFVCRLDLPDAIQFDNSDAGQPKIELTDGFNVILTGGQDCYEAHFNPCQ